MLKGDVKHVLFYSDPVQYCEFNMFSYLYCDLDNQQTDPAIRDTKCPCFQLKLECIIKHWFKWQVQWKVLKEIPNQTYPLEVNFSVSFALKNELQLRNNGCILSFQQRERCACSLHKRSRPWLLPSFVLLLIQLSLCGASETWPWWLAKVSLSLRFNVNFFFLIQFCFIWT